VSDDGRYLVLTVSVGSDRRDVVVYADLAQSPRNAVELVGGFEADLDFVGNDGPVFYFRTDSGAPRGRIIAIDIRSPQRAAWREVVGEQRDTLQGVELFHDTFVARFLQDASSRVRLFKTDGTPAGEVSLPGLGTVGPFTGTRRQDSAYYSFTGFTAPATSHRLDVKTVRPRGTGVRPRRSTLTRSSPRRCSTPRRTAPGCRCSCHTGRPCPARARTLPCCTASAASPAR